MSTVIETLDQEISTTDAAWPLLSLDTYRQVDRGTMVLFDVANPACWPGGVVGSGIAAGAAFVNLANEQAELLIDGSTLPTYDAASKARIFATTAGLIGPTGAYDLAALGWPNFHLTVWHKLPASPSTSSYEFLTGYGTSDKAQHQYGVSGAFTSGSSTVGSRPLIGATGTTSQRDKDAQSCSSATLVDTGAGDGTRRYRQYYNNALVSDTIITPSPSAQPSARFRIGKGQLGTLGASEDKFERAIFDNCGVTGVDPEDKRKAEWKAVHEYYGYPA